MAPRSDGILTGMSTMVPQVRAPSYGDGCAEQSDHQLGNGAMHALSRTHTLRVYCVRSIVDGTTPPSNKEPPMFALIRQLSRYILISN
jgi:hypothetical protein